MNLVITTTCAWCHNKVLVDKHGKMRTHFDYVPYRICEGSGKEVRDDKTKTKKL